MSSLKISYDIPGLVVPITIFLDILLLLTRRLLNQGFLVVKLKSLLGKFCGRYHDLVYGYIIAVSQMTSDMFPLHYTHKNNYKSVSTIPIRITIKVFPLYP
jgi:hypothetical protein